MSYADEIETLSLFNQKVGEILSYSYFEEKQSFTISAKKGEPVKMQSQMPSEEQVDSILLTIRLFMQDNDKISIRNVSKIYDNLPLDLEIKDKFADARNKLNAYLDSKMEYRYNDKEWTRRELLESIIYGEKAHLNESKKGDLKIWNRDEMSQGFTKLLFNDVISTIFDICDYISHLNKKVIENLS